MHKHAHSHGPRQTIGKLGHNGFCGTIGHTPLIRLNTLSELTGCEILGKAEFLNPGGSIKDRTALAIVEDAEERGLLKPGGTIVEGTGGNTGIGLTLVGRAKGYRTVIVIPDSQSAEKMEVLRALGAEVRTVPVVPYTDSKHYCHVARQIAEEIPGAYWTNQFDNLENRHAHFHGTGEEIWEQTGGRITGFVAAVGTGGTLAGVSECLKEMNSRIRTVCADPRGSAMDSWVRQKKLEVEGESVIEGIGQARLTKNFEGAPVDDAYRIEDRLALEMLHFLLEREGLFLGGSSGLNVCGAVRLAREMGPGNVIVTVLCDSGHKYLSRLFNPEWLREKGLLPSRDWGDGGRLVERLD